MTRETAERIAESVARGDMQTARELFENDGYTVVAYKSLIVVRNPNGAHAVIAPYMRRETLSVVFQRIEPDIELETDRTGCRECPERHFTG
jgi:ketosteroid isomerase-like protein